MIVDFFKQSKPVVYIVLGIVLTLYFGFELSLTLELPVDFITVGLSVLKYFSFAGTLYIFDLTLKQYEVQKRHCLGNLFFALFISLCMPFLIEGNTLFALLFVSLAIYQCYKFLNSGQKNLVMFQVVLFLFIASLFEPNFIYLLFIAFGASILFSNLEWRLYLVPIFSISTVVVLVQVFALYMYNKPFGVDFFFQTPSFNFDLLTANLQIWQLVFWLLVFILFVYQIINVNQKRAIFHKNNAKYFFLFIIIGIVTQLLTTPTIENLWVLSTWPFAIYIADFIWRIRSKFWAELVTWIIFLIILSLIIWNLQLKLSF